MPKVKEVSSTDLLNSIEDRRSYPKLNDLHKRLQRLRERRDAEMRNREDVLNRLNHVHHSFSLDRLAETFINDPTASNLDARSAREELLHIDKMIEGLNLAIQQTHRDIVQVESQADADACKAVRPLHRQNVRKTINSMLVLQRAIEAQQDLIRQLQRRGVERTGWLVPLFPVEFAEGTDDPNSHLSNYLRGAVDQGAMTEAERLTLVNGSLHELDLGL